MNKNEPICHECNGVGLLRSEDPMQDRVYGVFCPACNGTGMASDPHWRRVAFWGYVAFNVVATIVLLKACGF